MVRVVVLWPGSQVLAESGDYFSEAEIACFPLLYFGQPVDVLFFVRGWLAVKRGRGLFFSSSDQSR